MNLPTSTCSRCADPPPGVRLWRRWFPRKPGPCWQCDDVGRVYVLHGAPGEGVLLFPETPEGYQRAQRALRTIW